MNFLLTWIHWGLAALLYLQSAELSKAAPALGDGERKPNEVIKFLEVYERSFCRTIETLVDIFQEYPDEVEYIFKPSCVPLMRCAGCCGDEGLECVPVDVYNVTMEIMRIKPHQSQHIAHMSFLQHSKCDCRPKKDVKNKQEKWAQKPRSDGPSFIPQTWSLRDPQPWQSFLMFYPESGKSRRVCPTRMDSRVLRLASFAPVQRQNYHQPCSRASGAQLHAPRPGAGQCVRSEQFPFPWGEPLCSGCLLPVSAHPCLSPGTIVCSHRGCVMLSQSFLFLLTPCPTAPCWRVKVCTPLRLWQMHLCWQQPCRSWSPLSALVLAVGRLDAALAGVQEGQ
ncbi:vascular endothelial growth factor A, long form isoform X1 [Pogoniulus pusillus]|uniref:vascular endothelial growth factor A, long form isoform X1 n=1 Tax=Pogoniulus pusillus TaxID=488313 RepID=UPI0030B9737F